MTTPIICAGFHRSGTSLAAQIMHLAGLPFAAEPMAGNISNPDGHFEDLVAMRMHDQFLSESETTWKYQGECQLNSLPRAINRIKKYSQFRTSIDGDMWLMKDPRATLFLNEWNSATQGNAKFVLMYRHWGLCVQSIFKRSSRDLLSNLSNKSILNDNFEFWENIELSARMWLEYNRRLLAFYNANKERSLLVSQQSILEGFDLITALNEKFHFHLEAGESPIKREYATETLVDIVIKGISKGLKQELDDVYLALTSINPVDICKTPDITKSEQPLDCVKRFFSEHLQNNQSNFNGGVIANKAIEFDDDIKKALNGADFKQALLYAEKFDIYKDVRATRKFLGFVGSLEKQEPFNLKIQEMLGRSHFVCGHYKKAEVHYFKAIAINPNIPYLKMLLADTYFQRYDFESAEYFLKLAYRGNPNNPQFSIKLGDLNFLLKKYDIAIDNYKLALNIKDNDGLKCKIIDAIRLQKGNDEALKQLNGYMNQGESKALSDKQLEILLEARDKSAKLSHLKAIKESITSSALLSGLGHLDISSLSIASRASLLFWFSQQLQYFFSSDEIHALLSPANKKPEQNQVIKNRRYPVLVPCEVENLRPISFVVIKFSDEIKHNFYQSKGFDFSYNQIIEVDNTANLYFENLNRAIRNGINKAIHKTIVIIHEDVLLVDNWHSNFEYSISQLEVSDPNWGMLGAVGWKESGEMAGHWSDPHEYTNTFTGDACFSEVIKLDEQLLVFNRDRLPDFDGSLPGIHHLGSDYRNQLVLKGFKTYAINAPSIHKYADASGKLIDTKIDSPKIKDRTSLTYLADKAVCDRYIQKKWPQENIPHCLPLDDLEIDKISTKRAEQLNRPIILLSRGGSGSRLCSLLAQDIGLFLGNNVSGTGDAMELVSSVYQGLISKYRCFEDWQKQEIVPRLRKAAHEMLSNVPEDVAWGFKLPETLFLLPEIREAFPNAKFVHFVRDPLTTTLRRTHMTARLDNHIGRICLPMAYDYFKISRGQILKDSPALHMAYSTAHQLDLVDNFLSYLDTNSYIELRYEDVLSKPREQTIKLSDWLQFPIVSSQLEKSVDVKRAQTPSVVYTKEIQEEASKILIPIRERMNYKVT